MAVGYRSAGVDFDDLFELRGSGAQAPNSGYRFQGADLSARYLARGTTTKRADVGYQVSGSDVSNLWMPKGSLIPLGFNGKGYRGSAQAPTGGTTAPIATVSLIFQANGDWVAQRVINGSIANNGTTILETGRWLPDGQSNSDFTVQFTTSLVGDGTITNSASAASALTTGRTAALQNTVPANSAQFDDGTLTVAARLVRVSTGAVSVASCTLQASALGYQ